MKYFSVVIGFLGIILLYLASESFISTNSFIDNAKNVNGTIIDFNIKEEYSSEDDEYYSVYYPIIEFVKVNGDRNFIFESDYSKNNSPEVSIGSQIDVLYIELPNNQFHAKWNTYGALRMSETILGILGTVVMTISIIMFIVAVNKKIK